MSLTLCWRTLSTQLFLISDNCQARVFKRTRCLEPKKWANQKGTTLYSATKKRWWNACQLILLRPSLRLHGELEDMSSAPVMQGGYWAAHIWNAEWCPNVDLLHSRHHSPAEQPRKLVVSPLLKDKGVREKPSLQSKRAQADAKSRGFRAGNISARKYSAG